MGIFSVLNFFKRKPKAETVDYSSLGLSSPTTSSTMASTMSIPATNEFATQENIRAKIDLMMTQIDSMRIQHESMNERIAQIEKMVKQLLDMSSKPRF